MTHYIHKEKGRMPAISRLVSPGVCGCRYPVRHAEAHSVAYIIDIGGFMTIAASSSPQSENMRI